MLIYQSEGFLEVDDEAIHDLYRSTKSITLEGEGNDTFELQSIICLFTENNSQICQLAFYCRALKRAMVFAVKETSGPSALQVGKTQLKDLGFPLEKVRLSLSPAMRQVVLRDVPGFLSPTAARKLRAARSALLAGYKQQIEQDPESATAQKAQLKLNSELRLDGKADSLRKLLEETLAPTGTYDEDTKILAGQVAELTEKLATLQNSVVEERQQKEMAEQILAAAEKRIQELEEVLVDVDTKTATAISYKQEIVKLEGRLKEAAGELAETKHQLEEEHARQEDLANVAKAAHGRIKSLEEELTRAAEMVAEAEQTTEAASRSQADAEALSGELQELQKKFSVVTEDKEELNRELQELHTRLKVTEKKLEMAEKKSAEAETCSAELIRIEQEHNELTDELAENRKQLEQDRQRFTDLESLLEDVRDELEGERTIRKRLEDGAKEDAKRLRELDKQLARMEQGGGAAEPVSEEASQNGELQEVREELNEERTERARLEEELQESLTMVEALEKALKQQKEKIASPVEDSQEVEELRKQVQTLEGQLEQEQLEAKRSAAAQASAEKRLAVLEEEIEQGTIAEASVVEEEPEAPPRPSKPLPHEVRPEPKKGALFHPDWDLEGLPCAQAEQVLEAWESTFNVQLSLEGYPSQYCTAFMVILKKGKQKQLFLMFRLKTSDHTLVCRPASMPKSDNALKKAVKEGKRFLELSGFEMEKMAKENIQGSLGYYFLEV